LAWRRSEVPIVGSITTHCLSLVVGPQATVGVGAVRAVVLAASLAVVTLEASTRLSTDTYTVTLLDVLDILAHTNSLADDFVANTAWVGRREPSGAESV